MEIELNRDLINTCNNNNRYNRGYDIAGQANEYYYDFIKTFDKSNYNKQQKNIYNKRLGVFKEFLTQSFNEYLSIVSNFVSQDVAGPSNYDTSNMNKITDRIDNKLNEIVEIVNKFYKNTENMLKNAYSKNEIINKYRNGYNEPISSDDPLAKEKLSAKLEYLEEKHNKYKEFNKKARKNNEQQLPAYVMANSNQNIKSVKDRLSLLNKMENTSFSSYYFDGGEVNVDKQDMRIRILFDEKPDSKTRDDLKRNGFKWSPSNMAWQRKLTPNAIYTTKNMFKDIGSLEIKLVQDYTKTM